MLCVFSQISIPYDPSLSASTSTSLARDAGDYSSFVRGKSSYFPFTPGGIEAEGLLKDEEGAVQNIEKTFELGRGEKI
jgi:antiviral helicase SKI2